MSQIQDKYRGLTLLFDLNADLLMWASAIGSALVCLAWFSPV